MSPCVLERETGFEPATSTLARLHSTTELLPLGRCRNLALPPVFVKRKVQVFKIFPQQSFCRALAFACCGEHRRGTGNFPGVHGEKSKFRRYVVPTRQNTNTLRPPVNPSADRTDLPRYGTAKAGRIQRHDKPHRMCHNRTVSSDCRLHRPLLCGPRLGSLSIHTIHQRRLVP